MKECLEQLDEVYQNCIIIGLDYNTLLDRDFRFYNNAMEGFISKRELQMNDNQSIGHLVSAKIAQAVWGSKNFGKPMQAIRLRKKSREEKIQEQLKFINAKYGGGLEWQQKL